MTMTAIGGVFQLHGNAVCKHTHPATGSRTTSHQWNEVYSGCLVKIVMH